MGLCIRIYRMASLLVCSGSEESEAKSGRQPLYAWLTYNMVNQRCHKIPPVI